MQKTLFGNTSHVPSVLFALLWLLGSVQPQVKACSRVRCPAEEAGLRALIGDTAFWLGVAVAFDGLLQQHDVVEELRSIFLSEKLPGLDACWPQVLVNLQKQQQAVQRSQV